MKIQQERIANDAIDETIVTFQKVTTTQDLVYSHQFIATKLATLHRIARLAHTQVTQLKSPSLQVLNKNHKLISYVVSPGGHAKDIIYHFLWELTSRKEKKNNDSEPIKET